MPALSFQAPVQNLGESHHCSDLRHRGLATSIAIVFFLWLYWFHNMTERSGHYFWASIYRFDDEARQDVLARATQGHPDLSVTYDDESAVIP